MASWSKLSLSGTAAGAGAAVVVILLLAGAYVVVQPRGVTPEAVSEGEPDVEPVVVPEVAVATVEEAAADAEVPGFDVVQVAPDGSGVIAGTAAPDQPVVFMLDGEEIARSRADASGKFGAVLDFPASDAPRALSLMSARADGTSVASVGTVLISPVQPPAPEVSAAPMVDAAVPEPAAPEGEREDAQASESVDAPAVVLADDSGVSVLQPAPRPATPRSTADAPVVANVVIDTITYDDAGAVALAGRGAEGGFVRVYLNDKPIKTTRITESGAWEAPLPDVDAGVYRLRVDEVDAGGAVTSRVETPFQREAVSVATAVPQAARAVTVQPGFTLWAIARDRFGAGEQYVRVYEANRDLIRDPDLIYPGQVFALPEG